MSINSDEGPPSKRRRLSNENLTSLTTQSDLMEAQRQIDVGIREFVNPSNAPFNATLKKRYTDFLVNEILPTHEVVHLHSLKLPEAKLSQHEAETSEQSPIVTASAKDSDESKDQIPAKPVTSHKEVEEGLPDVAEDDRAKLVAYFDEKAVTELLKLYQSIRVSPWKKSADHPVVHTAFTTDRSIRSEIHQSIRRIFKSSIESSTDHDGVLVLTAAKPVSKGRQSNGKTSLQFKNQRPGKLGWLERGGEYLHFTLFKENKDTMEVISWLSRNLKCNPKNFQFAGTKDRRAVTAQRCSAYRVDADRLQAQNKNLRGSKIGDFDYRPQGLELGDLAGNEFIITLRDFQLHDATVDQKNLNFIKETVQQRLRSLHDNGYLNYFGLQRFGTYTVRTDIIGRDILKGDFQAACDDILFYTEDAADAGKGGSDSRIGQDDKDRALAIQKWRQQGRAHAALDTLPRKFSAEAQLIRHLSKNPKDPFGALLTVQRNLRLMYVHAYQSYVWNMALSNRTRLFGNRVVKGDLVLVKDQQSTRSDTQDGADMTTDADGEQIIVPADHDRAAQEDDVFERARALTDVEASSGEYTIFDVVLPLPGYDIAYPENESGDFYKAFMSSPEGGKLDPYDMRRKQREFSLSGSYRKIVEKIGSDFEVSVYNYDKDEDQFVETDLDRLERAAYRNNESGNNVAARQSAIDNKGEKVAVVLKFQLGSSQYATMALRELSRNGIEQHKPDFGGGR